MVVVTRATASATVTWTTDLCLQHLPVAMLLNRLVVIHLHLISLLLLVLLLQLMLAALPTVTSTDGTCYNNIVQCFANKNIYCRDACGNTATTSRTVTWIADLTPPVITIQVLSQRLVVIHLLLILLLHLVLLLQLMPAALQL